MSENDSHIPRSPPPFCPPLPNDTAGNGDAARGRAPPRDEPCRQVRGNGVDLSRGGGVDFCVDFFSPGDSRCEKNPRHPPGKSPRHFCKPGGKVRRVVGRPPGCGARPVFQGARGSISRIASARVPTPSADRRIGTHTMTCRKDVRAICDFRL